ncbi:hypothetical protein D5400_20470 [Georhizobium profundi]|uniref:Uncharacterized protein n=1 Tax=Georhizobium profundi TaxID=2341112 RepID=A0A3Q8XR10_9HYPH|nr:hypothetical protein [Georhizobium profundi]AZN73345.1 hypothetical protein D5400_20470 [Georhizobium profundi]
MHIFPACSIKALSECEPNQLVRGIGHSGLAGFHGLAATVVDQPDSRALIILDDGLPAYHVVQQPDSFQVIAFDAKPTLEVDPFGPFEAQAQTMFSAIGVVSRSKEHWLMRVREHYSDFRPRQGCLNLRDGTLINPIDQLSSVAFFGKWRVTMPAANGFLPPIEVASFEWKESAGR